MARRVFDILEMSANKTRNMIIHSFLENLLIVSIVFLAVIIVGVKLAEQFPIAQ